MRILSVWAPPPKTVLVQVGENRIPMIAGTGGRWTPAVPAVESGSNYGFILDDEGPLPARVPPGSQAMLHALSRLVEDDTF